MSPLQHKAMGRPDEIRPFEGGGQTEIFEIADSVIGRMVMEPGWTWQKNVRPIAGTDHCMYHHLGYVLTGELGVRMEDGTEAVIGPNEMFEIPPGHDAWVVGDVPWVAIDFRGARSYARPVAASVDRILATILFTDIVDSTKHLEQVGDAAWNDTLSRHHEILQFELDRYRGREVKKTGDGILAVFDGPARGVECAASMVRRVRDVGVEIRAGLHTGEIEVAPGEIHGVAVHLAARIMALAGAGEVLLSGVTRDLLAGAGHSFESAGRHALKGIEGEREVFRLLT